jgi:hypothetical protein
MVERELVCGVALTAVNEKRNWFVRLQPVVSAEKFPFDAEQAMFPEPFPPADDMSLFVYGWTEHALKMMDRFGVPFLSELHGPVLLPSADEGAGGFVRVWVSSAYAAGDGNIISKSVIQVVDAWMAGELGEVSADEKGFLEFNYPAFRHDRSAEYNHAVQVRLQAVREAGVGG